MPQDLPRNITFKLNFETMDIIPCRLTDAPLNNDLCYIPSASFHSSQRRYNQITDGLYPRPQLLFCVEIDDDSLPRLIPGFCSIVYFRDTTENPSMIFLVRNRTCNFHNFNEVENNSGFVQWAPTVCLHYKACSDLLIDLAWILFPLDYDHGFRGSLAGG